MSANGSLVYIRARPQNESVYEVLVGELSHVRTLENSLIDVTDKSLDFRTLLDGEGLQSVALTFECVFNTQHGFNIFRDAARTKKKLSVQILNEATQEASQQDFLVVSFVDQSPMSEALRAAFTLQSTGADTELTIQTQSITSWTYPLLEIDEIDAASNIISLRTPLYPNPKDNLDASSDIVSLTLKSVVVNYEAPPEDELNASSDITGLTLKAVVIRYNAPPEDELNASSDITDLQLKATAIRYTVYDPDELSAGSDIIGLTLT